MTETRWWAALRYLRANTEQILWMAGRAGVSVVIVSPASSLLEAPAQGACSEADCATALYQQGLKLRRSDPRAAAALLKRARDALCAGRPLPMALREAKVWGDKERLFEPLLPGLDDARLSHLIEAASICDGVIKGLRRPDWPDDAWDALRRLVLMTLDLVRAARAAGRRGASTAPQELALGSGQ